MKCYIPINTIHHTFALGTFRTWKEAEDAYFEYLTKNPGFDEFFETIKPEFEEEFGEKIETLEDLKETLFNEDGDYGDFWADHVIFTIESAEMGELFHFYQWCEWVENYEERNLFNLLESILECRFEKMDIDYYAAYHPILGRV